MLRRDISSGRKGHVNARNCGSAVELLCYIKTAKWQLHDSVISVLFPFVLLIITDEKES